VNLLSVVCQLVYMQGDTLWPLSCLLGVGTTSTLSSRFFFDRDDTSYTNTTADGSKARLITHSSSL